MRMGKGRLCSACLALLLCCLLPFSALAVSEQQALEAAWQTLADRGLPRDSLDLIQISRTHEGLWLASFQQKPGQRVGEGYASVFLKQDGSVVRIQDPRDEDLTRRFWAEVNQVKPVRPERLQQVVQAWQPHQADFQRILAQHQAEGQQGGMVSVLTALSQELLLPASGMLSPDQALEKAQAVLLARTGWTREQAEALPLSFQALYQSRELQKPCYFISYNRTMIFEQYKDEKTGDAYDAALAAQDALFGGDWRKTPSFVSMRLDAVTGALEGELLIRLTVDSGDAHYLDVMQ